MLPEAGEKINLGRWVVEKEWVEKYVRAVDDVTPIYHEKGVAPPLALAARALGTLLERLGLPPGTIHASQELECRRMVKEGEEVCCVARLSRPMRRGEWQFTSADFTLHGADGKALISGKSTVLIPVGRI